MYTIDVKVKGIAPLMQHRFPMPDLATMRTGGKQVTGSRDFTQEWRGYFYATSDGQIYQPASHFESCMIKAAANFKVQGRRGKSYKDLFQSAVFITPEMIMHNAMVPDELDCDADKPLYLDMRPVVVQRARVVRLRPCFKPGWELAFEISVIDDQISDQIVQDILTMAGKTVGVGDFRPRFGRFSVVGFEAHQ